MEQRIIKIGDFELGNKLPLALLAGPCQIESRQHAIDMAGAMVEITKELGMNYIFKASFDKANRTSINTPRGVGLEEGMRTFDEIKKLYAGLPIVTDVHEKEQCEIVAPHVDMLQIPAFLCRQTDLVVAAARTGKVVNIKKGQFLAPWDMKNIVKKSDDSGNVNVCITERGSSFGYNTLVTDFRGLPRMAKDSGCPVILTRPTRFCSRRAGRLLRAARRNMLRVLARAAVAVGVAAVFIETHDNPAKALSDGPNMIPLHDMKRVLGELQAYDRITKTMIHDY